MLKVQECVGVLLCLLFLATCEAALPEIPNEGQIINECLERYGGLTPENAQRLQRFKNWAETYEEIPCFTNCYLNKAYDIYNETVGFDEERVVEYFGRPLFEACKSRLQHARDNCELAYKGLHCLASLENDPFVLIESMETLDTTAKTEMKECLKKFEQYEWLRLSEYARKPVREPIPCFTRCFLEKLQLFNERTRKWNFELMSNRLGVPAQGADVSNCVKMGKRRNRNSCAWMYREYTCITLAKP